MKRKNDMLKKSALSFEGLNRLTMANQRIVG